MCSGCNAIAQRNTSQFRDAGQIHHRERENFRRGNGFGDIDIFVDRRPAVFTSVLNVIAAMPRSAKRIVSLNAFFR